LLPFHLLYSQKYSSNPKDLARAQGEKMRIQASAYDELMMTFDEFTVFQLVVVASPGR
jgi:hypothetical protein